VSDISGAVVPVRGGSPFRQMFFEPERRAARTLILQCCWQISSYYL